MSKKVVLEKVQEPRSKKVTKKKATAKPKAKPVTQVEVKGEPVYTDYAFDIKMDPNTRQAKFVVIKYNLETGDIVIDAIGDMRDKKVSYLFNQKKQALGKILNINMEE